MSRAGEHGTRFCAGGGLESAGMTQRELNLPPRNAAALAALAMGVTGLILAPLQIGGVLGLVAMVLGVVALRRGTRRGRAVGGIITGLLAVVVAVATLAIFILVPRMVARNRENTAAENLRRLARATTTYGADWNKAAPEHMALLWPYLGDMSRVVRDPRAGGAGPGMRGRGRWLPPVGDLPAFERALDEVSDFWYAAPGSLGDARLITFYDRWVGGVHRLVAFADGHVERLAPGSAELHRVVERNNEARVARHLAPLALDLDAPPPAPAAPASAASSAPGAGASQPAPEK